MATLADLLDDIASLHQVHALVAGRDDWTGNLRKATAHVRSLQQLTAHQETREACRDLLRALAGLEALPAAHTLADLAFDLQRTEAAMYDPATPMDDRDMLLVRQQLLRHRMLGMTPSPGVGVPRVVHLIRTDAGDADLPLLQYLCYRSILAHCDGYRIVLHTHELPRGPRWNALLPHLETSISVPPQLLGNQRLAAAAHQADVWRLKQLIAQGGFYFDWDMLLLRSPEHLRGEVCVMALEGKEEGFDEVVGVSAIGAEPGSPFLAAWLAAMPSVYNPRKYVSHSTVLSHRLARRLPALVRILDHRSFYYPGWTERAMRWLFDPAECLPEDELREHLRASTGIHLFCSHANFLRWAGDLTERDIASPHCNLATLMRPHL